MMDPDGVDQLLKFDAIISARSATRASRITSRRVS
jgi:hypothetical protein